MEGPKSRRSFLTLATAALLAPLTGNAKDSPKAVAVAPKQFNAEVQKVMSPEQFNAHKQKINAYSQAFRDGLPLKNNSLQELVMWMRSSVSQGGKLPEIPEEKNLSNTQRSELYPDTSKGYPVSRFVAANKTGEVGASGAQQAYATNVGRIGKDTVLIPEFFAAQVYGNRPRPKAEKGFGVIPWEVQLQKEQLNAPIIQPPKIHDADIEDGAYVVALGKYSRFKGEDIPNSLPQSGTNNLTGFIIDPRRPKNSLIMDEMKKIASSNPDPARREAYLALLEKSMVMIADPDEWDALGDRLDATEDGFGQLVYTKIRGKWELMGVIHRIAAIAEDGSSVKKRVGGPKFARLYVLHGPDALREILRENR